MTIVNRLESGYEARQTPLFYVFVDLMVHSRSFPSSPGPLFQVEGRCSAFDMEIIFHSHANKTHFHKKGCAPSLILKVGVFGTRKWSIATFNSIPIILIR